MESWMQYGQVTDDEAVYAFVAKILLKGRVVSPPPGDNVFFINQYIALTP